MISEAKKNLDIEKALLRSKGYDVDNLTENDYNNAPVEDQEMIERIIIEQYYAKDPRERWFGKDWQQHINEMYDENGHLKVAKRFSEMSEEELSEYEEMQNEIFDDEFSAPEVQAYWQQRLIERQKNLYSKE